MGATVEQSAPAHQDEEPARTAHVARWLSDIRAILAVVALAAYLFLRIAYNEFYSAFALSPEDLGFGYLEIVTQSATGAMLLLVVAAAVVAIVPMILGLAAVSNGRVGVVLVVLVWGAGTWIALDGNTSAGWPLLLGLVIGLAVRGVIVVRAGVSSDRVVKRVPVSLLWRCGAAAMAAGVFVVAGYLLIDVARNDSERVALGLHARPTLWGVPLASWHADAATLTWRDEGDAELPELQGRCLSYLGEHDGTAYFVDHVDDRFDTVKISASAVVVRVLPGRDCLDDHVVS